jgi:hypothetical protein
MSFAYRPGFGRDGYKELRKGVTGFGYFACAEPSWKYAGFRKDIERLFNSSEHKGT